MAEDQMTKIQAASILVGETATRDRYNNNHNQSQTWSTSDELMLKVYKSHLNGVAVHHKSAADEVPKPNVKVSSIIGDFGPYQIAVVIFAALRALSCAMDGLSGPFLSPNIKDFQCEICPHENWQSGELGNYSIPVNRTCDIYYDSQEKRSYHLDADQCHFTGSGHFGQDKLPCKKWSFDHPNNERFMQSLTIEQSLICDREWLKSMSNSMYFVGATFGLLFWGVISDRWGRKTAYVCSHFVTLIFGFSALFANSMCSYILLRSINAFGMIGELIPRSIQVEIVATEYRFVCSIICQIGWAFGIILVPALSYLNPSYRFILAFPVALSLLMLPWLYYLPESARWLITNKKYQKARDELRRAARINGKLDDETDSKIEQFNRQVLREDAHSSGDDKKMGIWRSILAIFTNLLLLKDTISVFILLFVAEVVYFSLTLNVADLGGSLYINYIISGLSELVSIACCALLLAYLSRRTCLSVLLLASTVSYLLLALVNVYEDSLSMTLILAVNAFGKLTAIGNLMVIILVSQEVFPTVIRQFGTSLCITVGKAGSAVAPFTHELGQIIGQSYCFAMFSVICLSCAVVPFVLSETGNRELPDTVVDVEEGANRAKKMRRKESKKDSKYVVHYQLNGSITNLNYISNEIDAGKTGIDFFDHYAKQTEIEEDINNNNNNDNGTVNNAYAPNGTCQDNVQSASQRNISNKNLNDKDG